MEHAVNKAVFTLAPPWQAAPQKLFYLVAL
jgi:hypothetical protein